MSGWLKALRLLEAGDPPHPGVSQKNWRPDKPDFGKMHDLRLSGKELSVVMSALFHHRDAGDVDPEDKKLAAQVLAKIQR